MGDGQKAFAARYPVFLFSDKLRQVCKPVTRFDQSLTDLITDLFETCYAVRGVGLAAPQVHIFLRLSVVNVHEHEVDENNKLTGRSRENKFVLINPEIEDGSGEETMREGCLSLPKRELQYPIKRFSEVLVKSQDENGEVIRNVFNGLMARAVQHEIDHLNGKIYLDHAPPFWGGLMLRKYQKMRKLIADGRLKLREGFVVDEDSQFEGRRHQVGDDRNPVTA